MLLRALLTCTLLAALLPAQAPQYITLPDQSPLATLRVVFRAGSASDPKGDRKSVV